MKATFLLIFGVAIVAIAAGCNTAPSATDLLPGPYGPPYLLISERLEDKVAERCYGILYGGVEPGEEVCFHVLVLSKARPWPQLSPEENAKEVMKLQRAGKGWDLLGTLRLGDEAHELTSTYCKGAAPTLRCEWAHVLAVRKEQVVLRITRTDHVSTSSLADANAKNPFKYFSESSFLQAEAILASWQTGGR